MPGAAPAISLFRLPDVQPYGRVSPQRLLLAMPRYPVAIMGAAAISDGYGAPANQTSSNRSRPLSRTDNDDLWQGARRSPPPVEFRCRAVEDVAVVSLLERQRDRPAGTPADHSRKRIRSVKKLVAHRD
jgi:hypothetical protein